jgi:hypothetical protein
MPGKFIRTATVIIFLIAVFFIGVLVLYPGDLFNADKEKPHPRTKVIIPQPVLAIYEREDEAERLAYEDSMNVRVNLESGWILAAVLNENFDADPYEEQIAAYRKFPENENAIYITYIKYDEKADEYKRIWDVQTAVSRPDTLSLYTKDLIGDHSICVLVGGMNNSGEHTLTVFRKDASTPDGNPFTKIAEIQIDVTITVQEAARTQAYQMGIADDKSYTIAAYGHDTESTNLLDQREIIYSYNPGSGIYEASKITRIPGIQIEQRRLRELLSGKKGVFENFIEGLWYYIDPQGMVDASQYIYFDPQNREIIFYGDETQQVFTWQNSNSTRYGIYIASQNISVTTLRRSIDIELESLERIKVRVIEDVRLKLGVSAPWDGSYRKAPPRKNTAAGIPSPASHIDALYSGAVGRFRFMPDGSYELDSGGAVNRGKYSFFLFNDQELLELRPDGRQENNVREIYLIEDNSRQDLSGASISEEVNPAREQKEAADKPRLNISLIPVRLGVRGIQKLYEGRSSLSLVP